MLVCIGVILAWIGPTNSNELFFGLVMLVMLPLSIYGLGITYFGGIILFGPEPLRPFEKVWFIVFWIGIAVANAMVWRVVIRSARQTLARRRARHAPSASPGRT